MGFLRQYCNEQWRRFALTNGSRSSEDRLPFVTASASVKMFSDDATVDSCLPLVIDRVATKPFSSLSCFTVTFTAWFWTTPWWSTLFRVKFWNQILLCAAVCKYISLLYVKSSFFSFCQLHYLLERTIKLHTTFRSVDFGQCSMFAKACY